MCNTKKKSLQKRQVIGKKQKVIESLPLCWWIISTTNQVQFEVWCIHGKELPDDRHSCAGSAGLQPFSLGVSGDRINNDMGEERINPAKMKSAQSVITLSHLANSAIVCRGYRIRIYLMGESSDQYALLGNFTLSKSLF